MTWPPHALTLTTPALTLRGMTEADALALAEVVPQDLEHSPRLPSFSASINVLQAYWTQLGQWRVEDWVLPFTVLHEGRPIGLQALEGKDFPVRRTVDSHSWLVASARGRGLGRQMRTAVLALAFDHLGAQFAVSDAWPDNAASLGVSRSLGYRDNGVEVHPGPRLMQRMLLARTDWSAAWPVEVTGLEACLPLLGLEHPG
jgi:RimJ/RimL family protein N-acetyltransferase